MVGIPEGIGLAQLLLQLADFARNGGWLKKDTYSKYVAPIWEKFEECHKKYEELFDGYANKLNEPDFDVKAFLQEIENDLNSLVLNTQIKRIYPRLMDFDSSVVGRDDKDQALKELLNAVEGYFYQELPNVYKNYIYFDSPHDPRTMTIGLGLYNEQATRINDLLNKNSEEAKARKNVALRKALNFVKKDTLTKYERVLSAHEVLKKKLQ